MNPVINTIKDDFGLNAHIYPLDRNELQRLPLFVRSDYELFRGDISGVGILWAQLKKDDEITPGKLKKQAHTLEKYFDKEVVYIIPELESWVRKRLVENHIAFIQPGKQLYIPHLLLQLSQVPARGVRSNEMIEKLSFPAQCMVIGKLNNPNQDTGNFMELASRFSYSAMTVTRIAKELETTGLAQIEGTKSKKIVFRLYGHELWEKALPFLSSPVKEKWFLDNVLADHFLMKAGNTALSDYTDLNDIGSQTFAIGKEQFQSLKADSQLGAKLNKNFGKYQLEVWQYNPVIIATDADKVDRYSLYLSLAGQSDDERFEGALQRLLYKDSINEITW